MEGERVREISRTRASERDRAREEGREGEGGREGGREMEGGRERVRRGGEIQRLEEREDKSCNWQGRITSGQAVSAYSCSEEAAGR